MLLWRLSAQLQCRPTIILTGAVSVALGLLGVLGWRLPWLSALGPPDLHGPMRLGTAVGFLLCGAGLLSHARGWRRTAIGCGVAVAAAGFLAFAVTLFAFDGDGPFVLPDLATGISDDLVHLDPYAALCLALSGVALLLLQPAAGQSQRPLLLGMLGLLISALGMIALLGQPGGIAPFLGWGSLGRLSLDAAAGFSVVGTGIFLMAWREGAATELALPRLGGDRGRLLLLTLIMVGVTLSVAAIATSSLYRVALAQQRERLVETAQGQAHLIETIARDGAPDTPTNQHGAAEALRQVRKAYSGFKGFGKTGEFTIARREGDGIVFLFSHRHEDFRSLPHVPLDSELGEPSRRSLSNEAGTVVGLDYRGEKVLAAYAPVRQLNLGVVAKIDLAEIQAPFFNALASTAASALFLALLGTVLFLRIGSPLVRRLEENEKKYRTLFDSATEGVLLLGDVFEECNEQICRMWSCHRDDIIGHTPQDFSPPTQPGGEDSEKLARQRIEAAFGGEPQFFYWQHRRKGGVLIDMDVSLKAVEVKGRKFILATLRDITDQKHAEERLRDSERRYRDLFTKMTSGASLQEIICDESGRPCDYRILEANPASEKLTGLRDGAWVGKTAREVFPEIDPWWIETFGKVALTGEPAQFERYSPLLGRHYEVTAYSPAKNQFATIFNDVTERWRAEEELRESELRFRQLADHIRQAFWISNPDGSEILYVSPAYQRIWGLSCESLYEKPSDWIETIHPDDRAAARAALFNGSASEHFDKEYRITGPKGALRWIRNRGSCIRDEDGVVYRVAGIAEDITKRKQEIESINQYVRDLRAAKLLTERQSGRLQRQAEDLAASNAELEQFAYVASHDLQEPLRMVAGYTQLLAKRYRGRLDADADEFIGFVIGGVQRMQRLITDVLTFSRVGRRGAEFASVDAEACLRTSLENLQATLQESSGTVACDPLPTIRADATQLTQLFQNLIGNAIKYRGDSKPEVRVSIVPDESAWHFTVQDNGIGIEPQYRDRVFQLFQRLHTREEYDGTGIGLAICKKIVERHGGRIWVESQPGQGSTFHFTLLKDEVPAK